MRWWIGGVVALLVTAWTGTGNAFCGFYVGDEDSEELKNDATQVVLMRHGRHTVMSIQNNYEGPPEDFALVVPVPTVLSQQNVRTLPRDVFDRVDRLASPRLVEYWEQNPCPTGGYGGLGLRGSGRGAGGLGMLGTIGSGSGYGYGSGAARPVVRVEAQFAVDEYDVVILGADESGGLETWLRTHGYRIPRGAARVLRPYVEAGTRFLVARVEAERLEFDGDRAQLSPLRIHYESDELTLPIRLGMLNADGPQDLIVHVLAASRYEVVNRPNVRIPTNLRVTPAVRGQFGTFYAALFDATMRQDPDAVVTEYAWSPSGCDPCPGPTLTANDIATLGGDATEQTGSPAPAVRRLAIRGRYASVSTPESDDEDTQRVVEAGLRRRIGVFDRCILAMARSGRVGPTGSFRAHIGFVLMPGAEPIAELAGPVPAPIAQCFRSAGRAAMSGLGLEASGPTSARAQINASWTVRVAGGLPPLTLTRLHTRYQPDGRTDDLVFREAGALVGGRGVPTPSGAMSPDLTAGYGGLSSFQARYAILHPWSGGVACASPRRGSWGGPPGGFGSGSVQAAEDLGEVRERSFALEEAVLTEVPGVDLSTPPAPPRRRRRRAATTPGLGAVPPVATSSASLVGCAAAQGRGGLPLVVLLVGLGLLSCRRRGARRPR